ncbi:hypothetical protein XENOCAPTIV_001723 [Xenoophorus captivus]|uniref:Uncharacterized protein n=1 Tax=Xenoophorus captivus TaxID=1517983 RepID=A0ABV0RNH2_9TELE
MSRSLENTDKGSEELSDAKSSAHQDDILAVCKLHGLLGTPTVENQLQALDKEYHLLKEQGQSIKSDYVQTLYMWLSKSAGKDWLCCSRSRKPVRAQRRRLHYSYIRDWSTLSANAVARESVAFCFTNVEIGDLVSKFHVYFSFHDFLGRQVKQDPSDPLCGLNAQFLRGLLTLGKLQQKTMLSEKSMTPEQVVAVLAAQSVSQCVCHSEESRQLEWVLLDAHFALLQRLIQQGEGWAKATIDRQSLVQKRCQALTALISLTAISPCQELLDMQDRVRVFHVYLSCCFITFRTHMISIY